jgi:hypothetical protein
MTDPTPVIDNAIPPSRPRWLVVSAGFMAAILAGGTMGALASTFLLNNSGVDAVPSDPVAVTSASASTSPTATAEPTPQAPDPSPTATADATVTPQERSPSETVQPIGAEGCFKTGSERQAAADAVEPIELPELAARLPDFSAHTDPEAYVGSSFTGGLGAAYVGGFAECTGVDESGIRFGHSTIGAVMGVVPMAIQVDGVTGPELVEILIGALPAENVRLLRDGEYEGWSYRFTEGFAVTASPDTLYLMQQFCCVDVMDENADIPTFEEIVLEYLSRFVDEPA